MSAGPPAAAGVHYVSAVPGDGYGNSAQGYLSLLEHLGVPAVRSMLRWKELKPIPGTAVRDVDDWAAAAVGSAPDGVLVVHLPPEQLATRVAACSRRRSYGRTVGIAAAETERVAASWADAVVGLDALVVPSTFNEGAFRRAGVEVPIHVVPHVWRPAPLPAPFHHEVIDGRYVFYAIGPWITRKALALTVTAFLDAFPRSSAHHDDVALVVKTGLIDEQARARGLVAPQSTTGWRVAELIAGRASPPPVLLVTSRWDDDAVGGLHRRGDCHVSLNRGEGFGLTLFDAAAAGNPVVATGWGGPLDYLGSDHPLLVDHRLRTVAEDTPDGWTVPSSRRWAVADHDHAVELLRWVAANREEAARLGARSAARIRAEFGVEALAPRFAAALGLGGAPG